jgi:hypothetical protein
MQSFSEYIQEGKSINAKIGNYYVVQWLDSAWKHIIGTGIGKRSIPLTSKLFKKIWQTPIRVTAFHITDEDGAMHVLRNQNKKGVALSVMPRAPDLTSELLTQGIWKSGVILKMSANILMAGASDIMSVPDKSGRRWVGIQEVERIVIPELRAAFSKLINDTQNDGIVDLLKQLKKLLETISGEYVAGAFGGVAGNRGSIELFSFLTKEYTSKRGVIMPFSLGHSLVDEIDSLKDRLWEKDQKKLNTILSAFVKKHIEDTNKIMETFLVKSREDVEQIAIAKNFSPENTFGYEELVANEYKILAVAWYPRDQWGKKLEKLETAVGSIPFFNLGLGNKQSTFKDLAGKDIPSGSRWLMPYVETNTGKRTSASKQVESDYIKFKNKM